MCLCQKMTALIQFQQPQYVCTCTRERKFSARKMYYFSRSAVCCECVRPRAMCVWREWRTMLHHKDYYYQRLLKGRSTRERERALRKKRWNEKPYSRRGQHGLPNENCAHISMNYLWIRASWRSSGSGNDVTRNIISEDDDDDDDADDEDVDVDVPSNADEDDEVHVARCVAQCSLLAVDGALKMQRVECFKCFIFVTAILWSWTRIVCMKLHRKSSHSTHPHRKNIG